LIVEGEAKVDLLHDWNVPATCCSGGAKKWKPEHAAYLRDADVVILPDNDDTGREHVKAVAASLQDVAANVRVLDLPNLLPKGDVIDWANNGGTVEQLHKLIVSQARQWTPNECHDDQRAPEFSDDNLALQFAERHAEGWRYVASRTRWLFWEKCHWLVDETLRAFDLARSICREAAAQCDKPRAAGLIASARTVAAVERLAKTDRRIAATTEQWDADLEIFNTPMKEQKA
jgi:DNA primase